MLANEPQVSALTVGEAAGVLQLSRSITFRVDTRQNLTPGAP